MARSRAERRANTAKKCKARKLACTNDTDGFAPMCGGMCTPSGERTSCPRCYSEKRDLCNIRDFSIRIKKIDDSWWKAQY